MADTAPEARHALAAATPAELLTFTMRGQFYAVDIMCVREIRGWSKPTPLPHAPGFMRGVINLRGTVLPILDLSARLNDDPTDASERNVIVVIDYGDKLAGLLVDAVSDILTVQPESTQPPPDIDGSRADSCISALCVVHEDMIRVLDLDALLQGAAEVAA